MEKLLSKPRLGVDFDNVMVDTKPTMMAYFESRFDGKYTPSAKYLAMEPPNPLTEPEFSRDRMDFMRDPLWIAKFPLCERIQEALHELNKQFEMHMNTARWVVHLPFINRFLVDNGVSEYFSSLYLRETEEGHLTTKLKGVAALGLTYAVEDDRIVAGRLAIEKIWTALISRAWNVELDNGPYIKKYAEAYDFAYDVDRHGSPEALRAAHLAWLEDPANRNKVFVAPRIKLF